MTDRQTGKEEDSANIWPGLKCVQKGLIRVTGGSQDLILADRFDRVIAFVLGYFFKALGGYFSFLIEREKKS